MFVNTDFAEGIVTQRYHTGILIFINNETIYWYITQQVTVEASTFDSKFIALCIEERK